MTIPSQIRTLADVEQIEQVPFEERVKYRSTYEMIRAGAAVNPQKVALHFMLSGDAYQNPMEITYQQLVGRIHQTANMFRDAGIGKDDVVGMLLPNVPHCHFTIWGGEAAGIVCAVNPALGADHIKEILQTARAKALVTIGPTPLADVWEKVVSIRKDLPDLQTIFQVMGEGNEKEGIYSFDDRVGKYSPAKFDFERTIEPTDIAAMFHTGGTTGSPKLAQHTHRNEIHDAWSMTVLAKETAEDVILCGLPLFHVNGVHVTGLAPFSVGATVVLLSPLGYRDQGVIRNFYKIVEHYKATTFSGVPTLYAGLMQVPLGDTDISSLRYAICGAAPMPVELFRQVEQKTGMKILEGYGLTEGTCASAINPLHGERRVGSIGLRFPYQEMKTVVVDGEGKYVRDCQPNEIGVVTVKGPNVFPGYLQPEHNAKAWVAEGWLNTGDLGRQDEQGYFWLTGRAKELIIRGGHNIDPMMIEEALHRHPAVALAAAVGRPDPYAGEVPMAYVALRPGASASEEELLAHCKGTIGEQAAVPKEVRIVESIPLTTVGKIFKPQLRWDATATVFKRELAGLSEMAERVDVTCGEDKVHGTLARVKVKPKAGVTVQQVEQTVKDLLGRYTVKYTVTVE